MRWSCQTSGCGERGYAAVWFDRGHKEDCFEAGKSEKLILKAKSVFRLELLLAFVTKS